MSASTASKETTAVIEYQDEPGGPWIVSRFPWEPEDVDWLNGVVEWPKYRQNEEA
ncbi:hypothetical protein ACFY9N_11605 [Microbacterium sp. NPDC008134]|uniref:hypothetical protein n=1 Tax=Microbacterium sp. NPDC008134 TaxID=3364183 RepID=UPI0036E87AF5